LHTENVPDNSQLSVLADEIRHFRKKNHFSLEMLADASGVSRSMISKIERCETVPSTVILSKLAEALGVTFSQLMAPAVEREIVHIWLGAASCETMIGFCACISPALPGRGIDWVLNTFRRRPKPDFVLIAWRGESSTFCGPYAQIGDQRHAEQGVRCISRPTPIIILIWGNSGYFW
jgi:transcriptional regulator with XRE-family HTH domain